VIYLRDLIGIIVALARARIQLAFLTHAMIVLLFSSIGNPVYAIFSVTIINLKRNQFRLEFVFPPGLTKLSDVIFVV